jgi:diguanylate cyclase (GGDEF)-like protein/PAS domain S-box-containing protein
MDMLDELHALLRNSGLDNDEITTRLNFLEWGAADEARLKAAYSDFDGVHRQFVERLYQHLGHFSVPAALLQDAQQTERLKHSQSGYYQHMWQAPRDSDYVCDRLRIGLVHDQVGLELKWYLGGYRLYLDSLRQQLFGTTAASELYESLLKAVFFDMTLTIDAYSSAQRRALERSEARYARALHGANDGLWDWHVDRDHLYLSERWASMLGLDRDQLGEGRAGWFARVHPEDLPALRLAIQQHLDGHSEFLHHQYRIRHRDGHYLWVLVRGVVSRDERGDQRLAGSQSDISEQKNSEQNLQQAARHDPLTGLGNRLRLQELLQQARQRRLRPGAREAALLFIDLDRFKLINDSLGHAAGDQLLVDAAQRLGKCLRPGDHLVRFGGDEFVALLDDLACLEDAEQVAQRMLDELRQPLWLAERQIKVSASIGIVDLAEANIDGDVLRAADLAMYRAKDTGKARFARYSADLQVRAEHLLQLDSALAQALERHEFEIHYQPVCCLDNGQARVTGVEALLRWRHNGQLVAPTEFIPALEESGQIIAVGNWVLLQACLQSQRWQAFQPGMSCAVNLSSRQLCEANFSQHVAQVLAITGMPASNLVLEITESQLMEDSAQTLGCLQELASLGVRLAIDDFGTGYSSLSYLTRFPLHILKVDKSFISASQEDSHIGTISCAIIKLGQSLKLEVIAEGVEQPSHLDFLREQGCRFAQGYLLSRPLPVEVLDQLFQQQPTYLLNQHHSPTYE